MTREDAIKVLNMVEAYGLADEAKQMAIEALKAMIERREENLSTEAANKYLGKHADITVIDEAATHGDLISRQDAMDAVNVWAEHNKDAYPDEYQDGIYNGLLVAKAVLEDLPSAEPVHGEWVKKDGDLVCSVCGNSVSFSQTPKGWVLGRYCQTCGAKMLTKKSPETLSLKADGEAVSKGGETNGDTD